MHRHYARGERYCGLCCEWIYPAREVPAVRQTAQVAPEEVWQGCGSGGEARRGYGVDQDGGYGDPYEEAVVLGLVPVG